MQAGNVFRAYDIRGIVDVDFTEEWVKRLGQATGTYFARHGISSAVIGFDCRHSSAPYHAAYNSGLLSCGIDVISIGMVPTPALYFAVKHLNRKGGVMITASHNPPEYNGFKIWAGESTIYADEIQVIRQIFEKGDFVKGQGLLSTLDILPSYKEDICKRFQLGRPVKVVVDGGNGMGGQLCADILTQLGAEVIPMFCEPDGDFPNHHPDPSIAANMQMLVAKVKETGADFGMGLDGDADRLGIVDPNGRLLFGDEVLSIYARDLLIRQPGAAIIGDVKCSSRLFDDIRAHGGNAVMWTTGHSMIKAHMQEINAPLAGEMSGHMFFAENWHGFDDAIYGAARMTALFTNQEKPMTALPGWPKSFATPEINISCPDEIKFEVVKRAQEYFRARYDTIELDGARVNFPHGWGLIRASNTQPVLVTRFEADSAEALAEIRQTMETPIQTWIAEAGEAK